MRVNYHEPSCSAAVGQDMIDKFTKRKIWEKYYRYFLRSYVEDGKKIREKYNRYFFPSLGCEYAIDFCVRSGSGLLDNSIT